MGLEDCHQRLKEHSRDLFYGREMHSKIQTSPVSWRANTVGRNNTVSWGNPWHAAYRVGTRQPGGKEGNSKIGRAWPLLNRKSGLSVRKGVLLYKQLIRLMMDYVCPIWRSAARNHVRKLQVLQSKCLRIATNAPWYVNNRQIHEDMGIPVFADHIRALTESLYSKFADAGNPLIRQPGWHLCRPRADWSHPRVTEVDWCSAGQPRLSLKIRPSKRNAYFPTTRLHLLRFPCFSSVVRQMPGYN
jgi:hypothetical protein